jgi:hypothetical protein
MEMLSSKAIADKTLVPVFTLFYVYNEIMAQDFSFLNFLSPAPPLPHAFLAPIPSVAEPHHFYAVPALGKIFDAAPAAPAPTILYSKAKFLKRTKV